MTSPAPAPSIRACIFDLNGLLINSFDVHTECHDIVLKRFGKNELTWATKAQMLGTSYREAADLVLRQPGNGDILSDDYFMSVVNAQIERMGLVVPLPGVMELLENLQSATGANGKPIQIALVTSSIRSNVDLKTAHLQDLLGAFKPSLRILGDDPRLPSSSSKPSPDIYFLALRSINESLVGTGQGRILPEECLVFEDTTSGVLAGRRAGMQVVWVPHNSLANYYEGREKEVLSDRSQMVDSRMIGGNLVIEREFAVGEGFWQGVAEQYDNLEGFPCQEYGIRVAEFW